MKIQVQHFLILGRGYLCQQKYPPIMSTGFPLIGDYLWPQEVGSKLVCMFAVHSTSTIAKNLHITSLPLKVPLFHFGELTVTEIVEAATWASLCWLKWYRGQNTASVVWHKLCFSFWCYPAWRTVIHIQWPFWLSCFQINFIQGLLYEHLHCWYSSFWYCTQIHEPNSIGILKKYQNHETFEFLWFNNYFQKLVTGLVSLV